MPRLHADIHLRLEKAISTATISFGPIEREVGILQELVRVDAVVRRDGDTDAYVGRDVVPTGLERNPEQVENPLRHVGSICDIAEPDLDNSEFVPAETRNRIGVAHTAQQSFGHCLEQLVSDRMPERVVDTLEMVEVEIVHGEAFAVPNIGERSLKPLTQERAIGQI